MSFTRNLVVLSLALSAFASVAQAKELVVYSSRQDHLIKPVFEMYTEKTGVKINFITDREAPLMARLRAEGANTPADMFMTVDAGNLWQAEEQGLFQPVQSEVIEGNIPQHLRSSNNMWTGLSLRARTIAYSTERVKPEELSTYEALADEQWKGRVCLRTSKKVYNQSLVATMLESIGEEKTTEVIQGWLANLATPVFADDTALLQAIDAGQCDVGIVNSYYFGRLHNAQPDVKVKLFWPNQEDRGVHVNISGAGVTRHAKHPEEATRLLEWMTTEEAQRIFADVNMEFPANQALEPSAEVAAWGDFKADNVNIEVAGRRQPEAIMLMDRLGWN
ncbi:extracellular solute-binding protein [Halopseudomonas formosensis]|uniref:Extracellular solute-binding protein n=1 Tax=Halopseudomonas formosensis TaxID=1002526 RepID=A0ABU5BVC3_9GAMM|nr:extracellular solute-binding protein [Halopseudomonas formosensis]MDX9686204.1 extracellular solute-binding protein [Halopseudomonas formosensis]NLC00122.1 extracellular solute-binding protein [Halopseudomonas formosensis]